MKTAGAVRTTGPGMLARAAAHQDRPSPRAPARPTPPEPPASPVPRGPLVRTVPLISLVTPALADPVVPWGAAGGAKINLTIPLTTL